jgi:hypothetical protein
MSVDVSFPRPTRVVPPGLVLAGLALLLLVPVVQAQELPSSVEIGGQVRQRSQLDAKTFAPNATADDIHELRTRLNLGFSPVDRVNAFVQVQDSRRFGAGSGTLTPPTNTFDLHQAYFTLTGLFDTPISLTLGRQELAYGNQRIVGSVGWHPRGRTFDGGVLAYEGETASVDLFAARLAPGFSGTAVTGEGSSNLLGIYSTWALTERQTLEVFALLDNNTRDVNGENQLTRVTPGLTLTGSVSQLSYTLEGAYQAGEWGTQTIGASLLAVNADYTFGAAGAPSVGAGYERLSGDADPTDDELGTFNTLFATNHKFYGYMDYFLSIPNQAPQGLQDVHLTASANVSETIGISAKVHHFMETAAPSGGSTEAYGQEVDLTFRYQFADPVSVTVGTSAFFPGDAQAPNGDTAYWGYVMTAVNL